MRRVAAPPVLEEGLLLHHLPLLLDLLGGSTKCAARTWLSGECVGPGLANIAVARREPQLNQLCVRQAHQLHDLQHIMGARLLGHLLPLSLAVSCLRLKALASKHLLTGS